MWQERIQRYILPGDIEKDPGFRREVERLSRIGLHVIGGMELVVSAFMAIAHILLDPNREMLPIRAQMLGTLLAPYGVVAIPPEIFGHLLPLFIQAAPGVVFNGDPPFALWEHPPALGRIPPHRSDAGAYLLAECFGCATITLIKDVDGLYERDPKEHPNARFIDEITVSELRERNLPTLPFDRAVLDLLEHARLVTRIQIINGLEPDRLEGALLGERVGTIICQDDSS